MKKYLLVMVALFLFSCKDVGVKKGDDADSGASNVANNEPATISYQIINTYPHDTAAFTEGLQFVDGKLYESVGLNGKSDIRISELKTGKVLLAKKLDKKYFGEGLTVLNGKAYQLTYQENTAFVYDAKTLQPITHFSYNFGEGWGMTTDGTNLIISNGGSNLYFYNPSNFTFIKQVAVADQYGPLNNINELEYIKGFVYANQWTTDYIFKINPTTGKVVGKANLSDLRQKVGFPAIEMVQQTGNGPEVMNGIAYDSVANKIFITGKNWPKLFEIKLDN